MIDSITSKNDRITRQAFREFDLWIQRYSRMLRENAGRLASEGGSPSLITSETLVDAVRLTCEQLAVEVSASHDGFSLNERQNRDAA